MKPEIKKFNVNLIELDSNEQIICEIRKHFFGFVLIYATGILIACALTIVGITAGLWLRNNLTSFPLSGSAVMILGAVAAMVVLAVTLLYAYIFGHNIILLTNEKIAQILYKNLFDRKVSQLNISDIQDVTVNQVGIFARIFDYGTIEIETAGEQHNYSYSYAPNPHHYAKLVISARESNVKSYGN